MNPEERFVIIMEQRPVEFLIFFVRAVLYRLHPKRSRVDRLRRFRLFRRFVFGSILLLLGLFSLSRFFLFLLHIDKIQIDGKEGKIFPQRFSELEGVQIFFAVFRDMQRNISTALFRFRRRYGIIHAAYAFPVNGLRALLIGLRIDFHFIGHHEHRIKAQTEMADNLRVIRFSLVFFQEILRAGERNLINIFDDLFLRHTDPVIKNRNRSGFFVKRNFNFPFRFFDARLAYGNQFFQLTDRVACVRYNLPQKDIFL